MEDEREREREETWEEVGGGGGGGGVVTLWGGGGAGAAVRGGAGASERERRVRHRVISIEALLIAHRVFVDTFSLLQLIVQLLMIRAQTSHPLLYIISSPSSPACTLLQERVCVRAVLEVACLICGL
jgi:hypothetical protein